MADATLKTKVKKGSPDSIMTTVGPVVAPRAIGAATQPSMFDFSIALSRLKKNIRVTRAGWNGNGMWVTLQKGYPEGVPANKQTALAIGVAEDTLIKFRPYLLMKTVDGSFVPWLASQSDLLADDWIVATN